ncbi:beta-phosphoglucomutase family hydrolase [Pasteurella sp. PK-2025]|uniref:beta-phosphoglucomutase family hydrolase n=1 Tax=Pasteurella sp. PK-2025 TaxID=3413133 RepID=UPI003C7923BF
MLQPETIEQYSGLIFDMDGTLIDTMPCHERAWQQVAEEFGYPLSPSLVYEFAGVPLKIIAQEMMKRANMPLDLLPEVMKRKRQLSNALILQEATLLPAAQIVQTYYQKKPLALGTGSHREITHKLLAKLSLTHYFDAVVTAEDVEQYKPAPDTFLRCAELIHVDPKNCLVFEDADLGVQAGLRAGMHVFDVRTQQLITG